MVRYKLSDVVMRMLNMDYCYAQSQVLTKGIANRDFVLSAIAQVKIYVPPIDLQKQYTEFVKQTDKSKFVAYQETIFIDKILKYTYNHNFRRKNNVH